MPGDDDTPDPFTNLYEGPAKMVQAFFAPMAAMPGRDALAPEDVQHWAEVGTRLQAMWLEFMTEQNSQPDAALSYLDPARWMALAQGWYKQMPLVDPQRQKALWDESFALWQQVLGGFSAAGTSDNTPELPYKDRRFADDRWRSHPAFALIHQTYLFVAERLNAMVDDIHGLPEDQREKLRFTTKALVEAASPANFPFTNPVVMERTLETRGENLVSGMEHMLADMKRGQLTHTKLGAFSLGENIATTPGKVVFETELFQLIQYSPTTEKVLETPLVIFPPWINRFYILDLNPKKSFVAWAVDQGITVFMVSWKSADASMKDVVWDDYIRAQITAIDHIRARLDVDNVHAIGYCVAGTTLAATLAILARRGEADKVASATFFTAQVDFEKAGDLLHFVDDQQLATIESLSPEGYLDGRYMAATFNLLRGTDLIWNYVVSNYLLGEDYPEFDLLYWNGDTTNLPAKWHQAYLRELYRDNRLVQPDSLEADGTPIDLTRIETPTYVQAGREDHIAPAESVWRITDHLRGPVRFVLAGSGHIAGVINPPDAQKYQYWINDGAPRSLEEFQSGATEHKGSWWPDWIDWIKGQSSDQVPAKGKRKPGSKSDNVIEDAPGRYVKSR
ncbi:class I poly(R)-hydroxyalkanoic acid synthase [Porphyrobacter algicida]|uniref:Class I poly(R)-hydroxyalkanoic acid synthase n=1 Tax=Qipengyuania algicida TaxID=1836209 RepID=A0A845AJ08_9SPHN|nr:class I poly(R)-hydroxyalkanoic acid synthase [Qipengyuania algicida]